MPSYTTVLAGVEEQQAALWPRNGVVDDTSLMECDVSSEVSALLELLPSGSAEQWQHVEQGLAALLQQARTDNQALQQKLAEW